MNAKKVLCLMALLQMILLLVVASNGAALWQDEEFTNNISTTVSPITPNNLEPVNITITSLNSSQPIGSAFLYCNFTRGATVTDGGYTFRFANPAHTIMYCEVPASQNTGGTVVNYYVIAYDEINQPLASPTNTYTVVKNGSWPYSSFDENILVTIDPEDPEPYEEMEITLTSKHSDIPISSAEISWNVETPGEAIRTGMASFNSLNPTTMNITIPGYEGDSNITFAITAYDQYYTGLTSKTYFYSLGSHGVIYRYDMAVEVIDDYLKEPAAGATVTISNESGIVHTGITTSKGLLMTPVMFEPGDYEIEVDYKSHSKRQKISIPMEEGNQITFTFEAQAKVVSDFVKFPSMLDYAGIIGAIIIPLLLSWVFYKKQRQRLLAITEKKKSFGGGEEEKKTLSSAFWDAFSKETKHPKILTPISFFALGVFGAVFIPFYPWWAVIIMAAFVGVVSYKFPFSALLLLSIFITASAAYQTPEFGLVFLVFSLIVMLCSFYDWRFGYLVFLTIFLARFGVPFIVPVFAAMVFSTFMAISVTLCSGVFLIFLVSSSNYQVMGLLAGVPHSKAFMLFDKPVVDNFTPGTFASVLSQMSSASGDIIGSVLAEGFASSMLPFFVLAFWCVGMFLISYLVDEKKRLSFTKLKEWFAYPTNSVRAIRIMLVSICTIIISSFFVIYHFAYLNNPDVLSTILRGLLFAGSGFAIYTTVVTCLIVREMFREYFTSKIGVAAVGARVSEMSDLSKTTFDQVGGLEDVKMDIKESVLVPLLRPDIAERFGVEPAKGILLFGAPGCGKTLTMKALATELNIEMFTVKCGDLMSKWYGESETRMMTLFKTAKERKPAIIFFDEIEAVAKRRDLYSADDVTPRLLSIMLSELDGMDKSTGIIIVGSTNKPELVDPALLRPGRFDKIMYIPPPDYKERVDILKVHITGKPLEDKIDLEEIAKRTEGFSGADLANLVKEAATGAMRRSMKTQKITAISQEDFREILPRIKPSISLTMKEEYERIKMRYERKSHEVCRNEQKLALNMEAVCGLDDVKKELRESIILPLTNRNLVEKFKLKTGRAILLHSPPGCGKTYLMKALANQYNIPLQEVTGSELKNAILADGTLAIRGLWDSVRDAAPAILFVSNIDSIASVQRLKEEEGQKAYSIFVSLLDNIKPTDRVVLVATSEDPDDLNPSLFSRGRFERKILITPPDATARKRMFEMNLKDVPRVGKVDFDELVRMTEGFSGEDINSAIDDAKVLALSKDDIFFKRKGGPKVSLGIKMEDLTNAISKIKPTVSEWEKRRAQSKDRREMEIERLKKDKEMAAKPPQAVAMPLPPPPQVPTPPPVYTPPPPPPPRFTPTAEDIALMTIAQLEEACRDFGLKPYGKKNILQDRLMEHLKENNGGN